MKKSAIINWVVSIILSLSAMDLSAQTFYDMPPGTNYVCNGVFRDPGGPNDYVDFTDTISTFCSLVPGEHIFAEFTMVDIEIGYDFLYVHDGSTTSAPVLDTISGPVQGQRFCSSSGCLTFHFVTDYSVQGAGWEAQLACVAECPLDTTYMMPGNRVNTCSGKFTDTGGDLSYQNFEDTVSTFCASSTDSLLRIDFLFVDIESGYDVLYIHDGPTTTFPILDSLDGQFTNLQYTSSQGCLTFHFISDYSVTPAGWEGELSCVADSSIATSVEENALNDVGIRVYPNPATERLILEYAPDLRAEPIKTVSIFDLRGKLVMSILPGSKTVDVTDLVNGNYILIVEVADRIYHEHILIAK